MTTVRVVVVVALMTVMLGTVMGASSDKGKKVTDPMANSPEALPHSRQQTILDQSADLVAKYSKLDKDSPKEILLSTGQALSIVPTEVSRQYISLDSWSLRHVLTLAKLKAQELHLDQCASDIETWVEAHPYKASFYLASAISVFAPEILSLPALEALGFGVAGVRAGSMAAKIQSVIGPVAARSVFAIWQSARMGGYGVEYVNGGVRALVALADAAAADCNPLKDCKGLMSGGGRVGMSPKMVKVVAVVWGYLVGMTGLLG